MGICTVWILRHDNDDYQIKKGSTVLKYNRLTVDHSAIVQAVHLAYGDYSETITLELCSHLEAHLPKYIAVQTCTSYEHLLVESQ